MFVFLFSVFVITPGLHAQLSSTIPLSVGPFSPQPYTSISTSSHSSETLPGHLNLESESTSVPYPPLSITQPTSAAHISQASPLPIEVHSVVGQWAIETMPDGLEVPFAVPSNMNNSDKPTCMAYYADWTSQAVPPKDIPYSLLDWIDFAFAIPDPQGNLTIDAPALLGEVVERGHKNGTKVKLSIGGWTGSRYFSSLVADTGMRQVFINNIEQVYHEYALDGIEIDWEYPGRQGALGNQVHPDDSENFLEFLRGLRVSLPEGAKITAAVPTEPFFDASGQPMEDCSEFAEVLDWILIMNYDTYDGSSEFGPNAPLYDGCKNSTQPDANAAQTHNVWTKAGFPVNKLVLGVPSYGYIHHDKFSEGSSTLAKSDDGQEHGSATLRNLVYQDILDGQLRTTREWTREWDHCSSTPFLRSFDNAQAISYDDQTSLKMKAKFASTMGWLGTNMFDISGDTPDWALMKAVREGLGLM
ncbi:hypothetical protein VKT23_001938 [Stygiomarasmius scandens]|uniref:GH18 domain-containing protein n=1 Tax=Marasmiellus scandens TaxID=2682957 RepID=A0ABR1K1V1_9AGAR